MKQKGNVEHAWDQLNEKKRKHKYKPIMTLCINNYFTS